MTCHLRRCLQNTVMALAACVVALPLSAQSIRLNRGNVAQLVDEVLRSVVPPDSSLSRVKVADRGIRFDHRRTMKAFGLGQSSASDILHLQTRTSPGSAALLTDCDQRGRLTCQRLGWGAYVWVRPVFVTANEALVELSAFWPERRSTKFTKGVVPEDRAILVGYSMEVYLTRLPNGNWKFKKVGAALVS